MPISDTNVVDRVLLPSERFKLQMPNAILTENNKFIRAIKELYSLLLGLA